MGECVSQVCWWDHCCGLGMVLPNSVPPPWLSQATCCSNSLPLSLPLLAVAGIGSTRGKDHRLRQEKFTGNSNAIGKQPVIATKLIIKGDNYSHAKMLTAEPETINKCVPHQHFFLTERRPWSLEGRASFPNTQQWLWGKTIRSWPKPLGVLQKT